MFLMN